MATESEDLQREREHLVNHVADIDAVLADLNAYELYPPTVRATMRAARLYAYAYHYDPDNAGTLRYALCGAAERLESPGQPESKP